MSDITGDNVFAEDVGEDGIYIYIDQKEGDVIIIVFQTSSKYSQLVDHRDNQNLNHTSSKLWIL